MSIICTRHGFGGAAIGMLLMLACGGHAARATEIPFSSRSFITTNFTQAESLVLADLNGKGFLDVVAVRGGPGGGVYWWENSSGRATNWMAHTIDTSFPSANSVAVSDLNGDGLPDVISAAGGSNDQVAWWENPGAGTNWIKRVIAPGFDGARSVQVADVDGDGHPDILAAGFTANALAWWRNVDGSGTNWISYTIATGFSGANSITAADVDRDGDLDVVAAGTGEGTVAWWRNNGGAGTNWTMTLISATFSNAQHVAVADMDGDGMPDVIGSAGVPSPDPEGRIVWWRNVDGSGTAWTVHTVINAFNGAFSVQAHDLDGDGDQDILATARSDEDVAWFENVNGAGTSWNLFKVDDLFSGARYATAGDLDGDGDLDVAASAFNDNQLAWWRNDTIHRSAAFCAPVVVASPFQGASSVAATDINRNGSLDIIGAASVDNKISWFENAGGLGSIWLERMVDAYAPGVASVQSADFDRDGKPDIVGVLPFANTIAWWKDTDGSGINWTRHHVTTNFSMVLSVAVADLDRDGSSDVVASSYDTGEISWWRNGGHGLSWSNEVIDSDFDGANAVVAGDINGDGWVDVIGASYSLGTIAWWRNSGDGAWTYVLVDDTFTGPESVTVADMDGDGDLDLIGASFDLDRITWWENITGDGTSWTAHIVDSTLDGAKTIVAADLDADGDLDLIGGATVANQFVWWENLDGSHTHWARRSLPNGNLNASAVAVADFNRDGKADIVGASANASGGFIPNIILWLNGGGQFALAGHNRPPVVVTPGATALVHAASFAHRGRPDDGDIELVTMRFRFERGSGIPLTGAEGKVLVENLLIYRDDGDQLLDVQADTLALTVTNLNLVSGLLDVMIPEGNPWFQVAVGVAHDYFVVAQFSMLAGTLPHQYVRVTHLTQSAQAEDSTHHIALTGECGTEPATLLSMSTTADLALGKSALPDSLDIGSNVLYVLSVTNTGMEAAHGVIVYDVLPAHVVFTPAGSSAGCFVSNGVVVCHLGSMTGLQVRTIQIATYVHGDARGAMTNTAHVTSESTDTNGANNHASAMVLLPDTDGDGIPDFMDPDDDNDSMPDTWEILFGFDPEDAADATQNYDEDDYTNLEEYVADTDPKDDESYPRVVAIAGASPAEVRVESSTVRVYSLQSSDELRSGVWSNIAGQVNIPGNGTVLVLLDAMPATGRTYRVEIRLPAAE